MPRIRNDIISGDDIYLDPQLKERSTSTVKQYEDADGYVSVGGTVECGKSKIPCVHVRLNILDIKISGGPAEVAEWYSEKDVDPNAFMWEMLNKAMVSRQDRRLATPWLMMHIVDLAYRAGEKHGKAELRKQFRALLDL
jgi:hypothetical protein